MCEIPTKGRIYYTKHCRGPDDHRVRLTGGYHCQIVFEYQCKNKIRVIQNMCRGAFVNGWVPNLAETRTLCQFLFSGLFDFCADQA